MRGRISIRADGREHELGIGDLLSAGKAVAHSVRSKDGAAFLLTLTRSIDDADG